MATTIEKEWPIHTSDDLTLWHRLGGADAPLRLADMRKLRGQRRAVATLMADGRWHGAPEIRDAAGGSEGLRRLRELRGMGFVVEKARGLKYDHLTGAWVQTSGRLWFYRLKLAHSKQLQIEWPPDGQGGG